MKNLWPPTAKPRPPRGVSLVKRKSQALERFGKRAYLLLRAGIRRNASGERAQEVFVPSEAG